MPPRLFAPRPFESRRGPRHNSEPAPRAPWPASIQPAFPESGISVTWIRGSEPGCSLLLGGRGADALRLQHVDILRRLRLKLTLDRRALLVEHQSVGQVLHTVTGETGEEERGRFELIVSF